MKVEYEPKLIEGVKPDVRLTHKDYFPVSVEIEMKRSEKAYQIKKEKAKKVKHVLLYIDGSRFELDSRTVTWVLDQLDFLIEQSLLKAQAPIKPFRYTEPWPWLLNGKKGDIFDSPRRHKNYREYEKAVGKLIEVEVLIEGEYKVPFIGRVLDVYKMKKENSKKNGRIYNEYYKSVFSFDRNDKDQEHITIVQWRIEEVL